VWTSDASRGGIPPTWFVYITFSRPRGLDLERLEVAHRPRPVLAVLAEALVELARMPPATFAITPSNASPPPSASFKP